MRRHAGRAFLLLAVFGIALPVLAQERVEPVRPVQPDQTAGDISADVGARLGGGLTLNRDLSTDLRVGPFRVRPGVGVGSGAEASVNARVDDRLRLVNRLFLDAGPNLDIVLPMGTSHRISVTGSARYRWYTNQSSRNGWLYAGIGGYEFRGRRFTLTTTYQVNQEQESQLSLIESGGSIDGTDIDERVDVLRKTLGGRAQMRLGSNATLFAGAARTETAYEDGATFGGIDLPSALDGVSYQYSAGVQKSLTTRTSVGLQVNGTRYSQREPGFRDNWRQLASVGANFSGDGALAGALSAGVERRSLDAADLEDFVGPFVEGSIRYRASARLGLWLMSSVRTEQTFWQNNVYSIRERVGTGLDFWVHRRVNLGAFIDVGTIRYPEVATFEQLDGSLLTAKRRDDLRTYRGTIRLEIAGQSMLIDGGYFDRDSNFTALSGRGYFVRVGISLGKFFSRAL